MNIPALSKLKHLSIERRGQISDNETSETHFSDVVAGRQNSNAGICNLLNYL